MECVGAGGSSGARLLLLLLPLLHGRGNVLQA